MSDKSDKNAGADHPDPWDHSRWNGEVLYLPVPTGRSQLILAGQAYWEQQRAGNRFPRRGDIDPLDLGATLLPYLSIAAIQPDPFRVQYRLVGTEVARFYGAEMRGKWLDEVDIWPLQDIEDTHDTYRRVLDRAKPLFGLSLIEWQERPDHVFEFARFPISDDGRTVTHCLGIDDFTTIEPTRGRGV